MLQNAAHWEHSTKKHTKFFIAFKNSFLKISKHLRNQLYQIEKPGMAPFQTQSPMRLAKDTGTKAVWDVLLLWS